MSIFDEVSQGRPAGLRWFRSLLGNVPLGDGVVVAGRNQPSWSEAPTDAIPDRYVEITALGPLPVEFADHYLAEAGVEDQAVRAAVLAYASVEPGLVHPLLLGLAADVALAAAERGKPLDAADFPTAGELHSKERELTARLLSGVSQDFEDAIIGMAAARSFDQDLFIHLGRQLGYSVTASDFRRMIGFSFVTPYQRPSAPGAPSVGRFTIHSLLRRALEHIAPDVTSRAHEVLADYYRTVPGGDAFTARLEHIYHRGRLDPAEGVARWRDEMDGALSISRYDRARSLVALLVDLETPSEANAEACTYRVARAEIALGRWDEAARLLRLLPAGAPYGAAMRMLPVGWAVPAADPDLRRELAATLARATHPAPASVGAACIVAAMAAWAVEGVGLDAILAAAMAEIDWVSERYPAVSTYSAVRDAAAGGWRPPPDGVTLDAVQTVAAVVHVVRAHEDLASALPYAVSLGGDTDTVAALVGGILGGRDPAGPGRLSWLDRVDFEERDRAGDLAAKLRSLRSAWYSR